MGLDSVRFKDLFSFRGSPCVGATVLLHCSDQGHIGSWEGCVACYDRASYSMMSHLHTPQVSWKAAWSVLRHVWTALNAAWLPRLLPLTLCLTVPAQFTAALSLQKHLSVEWQRGNKFISLTHHHSPHFSLSITSLHCFLFCPTYPNKLPPVLIHPTILPVSFVYLSHTSFAVKVTFGLSPFTCVSQPLITDDIFLCLPFNSSMAGLLHLIGVFFLTKEHMAIVA